MSDHHSENVRAARQRVIDELAMFRVDSSDKRLGHLKAAIDYWHDAVGAWSGAKPIEPGKQNLS